MQATIYGVAKNQYEYVFNNLFSVWMLDFKLLLAEDTSSSCSKLLILLFLFILSVLFNVLIWSNYCFPNV